MTPGSESSPKPGGEGLNKRDMIPAGYMVLRDLVALVVVIAGGLLGLGKLDAEVDGLKGRLNRHERRMENRLETLETRLNARLDRIQESQP